MSGTTSTRSGSTYSTGLQKPSVTVTPRYSNPSTGRTYYGGSAYYDDVPYGYHASYWHVPAAFAAGTLMGSMIHPWGGYYYVGSGTAVVHQPFSFLSALIDLIVLCLIIWLVWAIFFFRRRSRY